jgi:hypothetical protein
MADLVKRHDLGAVVGYEDVDSLARALVDLADPDRRDACADRSAAVASEFRWTTATRPLLEFCRNPRQAPDRDTARAGATPAEVDPSLRGLAEISRITRRALATFRHGGLSRLLKKGGIYFRRRRARLFKPH